MEWLKHELLCLIAKIEGELSTDWRFLWSFIKEAVKEEEAALFPKFREQAIKLFNDEAAMQGLSVKDRVALAVSEGTADLAEDIVIAKNALFNSWAWAIAHQTGQIDGNQGILENGVQQGG